MELDFSPIASPLQDVAGGVIPSVGSLMSAAGPYVLLLAALAATAVAIGLFLQFRKS